MRQTNQIYIPIPKERNTKVKVEVAGVDVTARVIESLWSLPVTSGIGTFNLAISNAKGQFSGDYQPGDVVKFYADNTDNTTLQFEGRVDYVKDDISETGQTLNIEGRHKAYLLNENLVNYSATNTSPGVILKAIIDQLPTAYGFTYANVGTDTTIMDVEWNYKPFWDCVVELCNKSGFDCYVDNDLDFHYFEENSIENNNDGVSEGDNFISAKGFGTNDYYEKTRVTVMGNNDDGLPIIYTSISESEDDIRELFIRDSSANTMDKVKNKAQAKLVEVTNRGQQSSVLSFGLETVKPGDNIWFIVPRQKMASQYKLKKINHKFGMKVGGWRTESILEEQEEGIPTTIQGMTQTTQQITHASNVRKFNYSYVWDFDENYGSHSGTQISVNKNTGKGVLKTTGGSTGTWDSNLVEADSNVTGVELRMSGKDVFNVQLFVSVDGGTVYNSVLTGDTRITTGKDIKIRVVFNSSTTEINSIALLYS